MHFSLRRLLPPLFLGIGLAAPAAAQLDDLSLTVTPDFPGIGDPVTFQVSNGTPGDLAGILISTEAGPTIFPIIGQMAVGLQDLDLWNLGPLDSNGSAEFECGQTCATAGIVFYTQAFTLRLGPPAEVAGKSRALMVMSDPNIINDCDGNGIDDDCDPDVTDCNDNGIPDTCDIADGTSQDCNDNGIPDECDIADGTSMDCNGNGVPDECEPDCNSNGIPDDCDIADGTSTDLNGNGIPDECEPDCNGNGIPDDVDIANGTSNDCDANGVPDECQPDCDADGIPDVCEDDCDGDGIPDDCDSEPDCNGNNVPDNCDIANGTSTDLNGNGIPDECEPDCNGNGIPDDVDIANGTSNDCDANGVPDECQPDCDADGIPDVCESDCDGDGTPDDCDVEPDCNGNNVPDNCDIANGTSMDRNGNGIPDECEPDCNGNGIPDDVDIANGTSKDCQPNGIPDECEPDCDGDGIPDDCESDCDGDGIPDDCDSEPDCNGNNVPDNCDIANGTSTDLNGNGIPDECEPDCNGNGIPDDVDIANGTSKDCQPNGIPDECEPDCDGDGIPDSCEPDCDMDGIPDDCDDMTDCNGNGLPDECDIFSGTSMDCNLNGVPDECEPDCNANGIPDECDFLNGTSNDCNTNGIPDECEPDCDGDGIPDECDPVIDSYCVENLMSDGCKSPTPRIVWIRELSPREFAIVEGGLFVENADGTTDFTGTIENIGNASQRFEIAVTFSGRINPGDANHPPAGSPKSGASGCMTDEANYVYYTDLTGTFTGRDDYEGAEYAVTIRGAAAQQGFGANQKNEQYGLSSWWDLEQLSPPNSGSLPTDMEGDFNFDLVSGCECEPCDDAPLWPTEEGWWELDGSLTVFAFGPDEEYDIDCMSAYYDGDDLFINGQASGPDGTILLDMIFTVFESGSDLQSNDGSNDTGSITHVETGQTIQLKGKKESSLGYAARMESLGSGKAQFSAWFKDLNGNLVGDFYDTPMHAECEDPCD